MASHKKIGELTGVNGWLAFFVFGLFMSIFLNIISIATDIGYINELSLSTSWTVFLVTIDITSLLLILSFIIYTMYSLIKIKPNAVALAKMYLFVVILSSFFGFFSATSSEITSSEPFDSPIRGLVFGIIWLSYFYKSKRVNNTWPTNKRSIYLMDKILFGSLLTLILVINMFLPLYFSSLPQEQGYNTENSTDLQQYKQENRIPIKEIINPGYYLSYVLYSEGLNETKPHLIWLNLTTEDSFDINIYTSHPIKQMLTKNINRTFKINPGDSMEIINQNDKPILVKGFVEYLD